jgi:hypothetical protein
LSRDDENESAPFCSIATKRSSIGLLRRTQTGSLYFISSTTKMWLLRVTLYF